MTKFQKKVFEMEKKNRLTNSFRNEIRFSDVRVEKHLNNILYGVWEDEFEDHQSLLFS